MVSRLIDYNKSIALRLAVDKLTHVAGIKNQIEHLNCPDDNEIWEYVFEYLITETNKMIKGWADIKIEIQNIIDSTK